VIEKLDKFSRLLSGWCEWIGVVGLLLMMVVTCVDVIGAKLFLRPVLGAIDIVMLSQLVAVSFAVASALLLGRHVQVEFFVVILPKRVQAGISSFTDLLGLVLFILIVWRLCVYGYSLQTGGEVSPTALIPLHPFAYGIALSSIPVCFILLLQFLNSVFRMMKK
jgi:TRAP-type C4-dicarboxylate transport system permease small subunit